jgi:hypothetical protein
VWNSLPPSLTVGREKPATWLVGCCRLSLREGLPEVQLKLLMMVIGNPDSLVHILIFWCTRTCEEAPAARVITSCA